MPVGADDLIGPKVGDGAGAIKRDTFVNKTRAAAHGGPGDYGGPCTPFLGKKLPCVKKCLKFRRHVL